MSAPRTELRAQADVASWLAAGLCLRRVQAETEDDITVAGSILACASELATLPPPGVIADVATLLGGYLGGWALLRSGRQRALLGTLAGLSLLLVVFVIVCRERLFSAGTFAQYHSGHAPSAGEGKLGWALVVTGLGMGIAIAVVGLALWEQGKRPRT